jgi:2'-5' RNA ligase
MPPTERPWRCFAAVPIGPSVRAAVEACVTELRARSGAEAWRWTEPEGWHVTLAFIGATDPATVPRLAASLAAVAAQHEPFTLEAGGLGTFPSRGRARVVWYGVADPRGRLARVARETQAALGLEPADRFRGHLTLARARDRLGTDAAAMLATAAPPTAPLEVDRVVLYRSHLGGGPARYEALTTAVLRGVPA